MGTPYRHQGRSPETGFDCIGAPIYVGKKLGLPTYDTINYSRIPDGSTMERLLKEHMRQVPITEYRVADLLHLSFYKYAQHIAIVSHNGNIIHAYEKTGKVVEHRLDSVWKRRIRGVYRFYGVEE